MSDRFRLVDAKPTGTTQSAAFVDYADGRGEFRVGTEPVYDRTFGDLVRAVRRETGHTLRTATTALGISVVDLSSLERGRLVPASEADAAAILTALRVPIPKE